MSNSLFRDKKIILLLAVLILLCAVLFFFTIHQKTQAQREDFDNIASLEFDTAFLSMYPIDTYHEEDFSYYRRMSVFKASYCMPDFSVVEEYMEEIVKSGNPLTTVYLGLLPDKARPEKIQSLADRYPGVTFEVILSYPSADYWRHLSEKDYGQTLQAYCDFLAAIPDMAGANFYFLGSQEWLVNNPANYEGELLATESIAKMIMLHSDRDHEYLVTDTKVPALSSSLTELTRKMRDNPAEFPDLSDYRLIFFGDSVIAGYNNSTSIPGTVAGRTGAAAYNCGYGGNSAAMTPGARISLPGIVEAFFRGDLSALPEGEQVYEGIAAYLSDFPADLSDSPTNLSDSLTNSTNLSDSTADPKLCFIINYGLNDYFGGFPVFSEDPYDIATYSGAIRTAVETIRTNAPDAQIILCTPTFTASYQNGTAPHGDAGNVLTDYVEAVLTLADELQTDVLDNYHDLGITPENHGEYLEDGVHPNAACRYLIGTNLIRLIR